MFRCNFECVFLFSLNFVFDRSDKLLTIPPISVVKAGPWTHLFFDGSWNSTNENSDTIQVFFGSIVDVCVFTWFPFLPVPNIYTYAGAYLRK